MVSRKINFLSFIFILKKNFLIIEEIKIMKGISIPNCFKIKSIGCLM